MSASLIVAEGVTKSLGGSGAVATPVLRGVTMSVARGEFVAIVGPSGCGKTTFLSLLGALDHADGGTLVVDGVDLRTLRGGALDAYRRDKIGLVLQFYSLLPSLNALENIETCLEFLPLEPEEKRARSRDYLDRVGLSGAAEKFPAQMSGGMQQRIAVARALARQPALLLADEPTGSLDRDSGLAVFETMLTLQRALNVTCVLVTHDQSLAKKTDRVVTMRDGMVL